MSASYSPGRADGLGRPGEGSPYMVARAALLSLGYTFGYNKRAARVTYSKAGKAKRLVVNGRVRARLRQRICDSTGYDAGKAAVSEAIDALAYEDVFDPVLRYYDGLPKWDGVDRLPGLFVDYFGAPDTPINRELGVLTPVAAVRRTKRPAVSWDVVPVLWGDGGVGKSKGVRALAVRRAWHSDADLLDRNPERQMEQLDGVLIYEIAEMVGNNGQARQKSFISRLVDRSRRAYAEDREDKKRSCILIGTTDKEFFLVDDNSRRFVPIEVTAVKLKRLRRDRDQLWAEAVFREKDHGPLCLPRDFWRAAKKLQDAHREVDPWTDLLAGAVGVHRRGELSIITNAEVHALLTLQPVQRTATTFSRISSCMVALGWTSWNGKIDGKQCRGFSKYLSS